MPALAEAGSYYVSPTGSGTACTSASPCSVAVGRNTAGTGDTIRFKSGTYGNFTATTTRVPGTTWESEVKYGAVIQTTGTGAGEFLEVAHSNTTVRGFVVDGNKEARNLISMRTTGLTNLLFEHNHLKNVGNAMMAVCGAKGCNDVVIRHNQFTDSGFRDTGECLYIGTSAAPPYDLVQNVQVYGNTFTRCTQSFIDLKPNTSGGHVHHNRFHDQLYRTIAGKGGTEGAVVSRVGPLSKAGHLVEDNIFLNYYGPGPTGAYGPIVVTQTAPTKIIWRDNVFYHQTYPRKQWATNRETGPGGQTTEITGNTVCDLQTYAVGAGLNAHDNIGVPGGAAPSLCDAQITRITKEMATLPGVSYPGSATPPPPPSSRDTVAPTVSLTAPAAGATVSGTVSVSANASDNVRVAGVQFKVDGKNIGGEDTASPYSTSLDTRTLANGRHTLTATARDATGNTVTTAGRSISVTNGSSGGGGATPPTTPSNPIFAVNAGGGAYTARDGTKYLADAKFSGGRVYTKSAAITNTTDDPLYQSERYGNFSYAIPIANGNYKITLKFAEIYWSARGKRQFDVKAEGKVVVSNLDLVARAGATAAYDVTVPVSVQDGTLNLQFLTDINNAKVSAILVTK